MRLVDADALLEKAWDDHECEVINADDVRDAPTIDAKPVTRCRDCKHCGVGNIFRGEIYPACRKHDIMVSDNFFCADGEKRC